MSRHTQSAPRWHQVDCDCSTCWPDAPSVAPVEASGAEMIGWTIVGFLLGGVITFLLDRVTDGPGMLVSFAL
jgi:hypothetical protein